MSPPPAPGSSAAIDAFIAALWIEDGLSANTLAAYRRDLQLYAQWREHAKGGGLNDTREPDLLEYGVVRHAASKASSVNRRLTVFKRYFRWALREHHVQADPTLPVATLVGPAVLRANPFLATLTAAGLLARAAREAGESAAADGARTPPVSGSSAVAAKPALPPLRIACAVERPSCKRWIALARQKPARQVRIANR